MRDLIFVVAAVGGANVTAAGVFCLIGLQRARRRRAERRSALSRNVPTASTAESPQVEVDHPADEESA